MDFRRQNLDSFRLEINVCFLFLSNIEYHAHSFSQKIKNFSVTFSFYSLFTLSKVSRIYRSVTDFPRKRGVTF